MAVTTDSWMGISAKQETGEQWMGQARVALRLPFAGWMSEMKGRSVEVRYINTSNINRANIFQLMGSPSVPNQYIFENTATISGGVAGGFALRTGRFPAGSTLTIINKHYILGGGGNGAPISGGTGSAGGHAIILDFPTFVDNTAGNIAGGGGGGGAYNNQGDVRNGGGGGGGGTPAGIAARGATSGTSTNGGAGGAGASNVKGAGGAAGVTGGDGIVIGNNIIVGGGGGGIGAAGGAAFTSSGGTAGAGIKTLGNGFDWVGGTPPVARFRGGIVA